MKLSKYKVYLCGLGAVCTSWGKSWKRHWYNEKGECWRCGEIKKKVPQGDSVEGENN